MQLIDDADAVRIEPEAPADRAVIWLHGLGADGHDFVPVAQMLRFPGRERTRFIFPHAPLRPVTINGGQPLRAWYDIFGLVEGSPQDEAGIRDSARVADDYLQRQMAAGIDSRRIVLAGFSQGGAIALHAGLRFAHPLAGLIGLSTYLPLHDRALDEAAEANRQVRVLLAHGQLDPIVPFAWGEGTRDELQRVGCAVRWLAYPMQHEVCAEEVAAIDAWLGERLA